MLDLFSTLAAAAAAAVGEAAVASADAAIVVVLGTMARPARHTRRTQEIIFESDLKVRGIRIIPSIYLVV